jgi:hypothetical protein
VRGELPEPGVATFLGEALARWDGLRSHRSRIGWDFVREQHGSTLVGVLV